PVERAAVATEKLEPEPTLCESERCRSGRGELDPSRPTDRPHDDHRGGCDEDAVAGQRRPADRHRAGGAEAVAVGPLAADDRACDRDAEDGQKPERRERSQTSHLRWNEQSRDGQLGQRQQPGTRAPEGLWNAELAKCLAQTVAIGELRDAGDREQACKRKSEDRDDTGHRYASSSSCPRGSSQTLSRTRSNGLSASS